MAEEKSNTLDNEETNLDLKKGEGKLGHEEKKVEEKIEKEELKIEKLEEKKEQLSEKEEEIAENIEEEKEKVKDLKIEEAELKKEEKEVKKEERKINENEEGIKFDIKKIKNIFKRKENLDSETKKEKSQYSEFAKKGLGFVMKNKMIFLLMITIFFSIFFRAYPISLPITDDWARDTVYNNIQNNIGTQINAQYPNLPDQQKNALIQKEFNAMINDQKEALEIQIKQTSDYFKSRLQDEDGQTYLLAIDPYLWFGYARNYINNGHFGNTLVNGTVPWYTLRNGRSGQKANFEFFPFMIAINYKIMNIFGNFSVMAAAFYIPLILMTLASIAAFFIGKKIGGYPAALTASIIVGVHAALLGRTAAGFSDTDNILTFFGLFTVMFFVFAFEEKNKTREWIYVGLAGLAMGLYALGHGQSWWYIFNVIAGAIIIYLVILVWLNRKELSKGINEFIKLEKINKVLRVGLGFLVSTWFFGILVLTLAGRKLLSSIIIIVKGPFTQPLNYIAFKQVAVKTVWPNVLTTVAELNKSNFSTVISQIGGRFLFFLSIIGIVYLFLKKEEGKRKYLFYGLLVLIWFVGTAYAAKSSIRFVEMFVPAFAFAIAAFVAFIYNDVHKWIVKGIHISEWLSRGIIIIILVMIIFAPILKSADATAKREIPSFNDAWYESLIGIQQASEDAIITSWWDFGHWFVAFAERRVTFDGGDQGERIHWAGKSLLTSDEKLSVGILRMLNCGQQEAPHILEKYLDNNTVKAIEILNDIVVEDKATAKYILQQEGLNQTAIEDVLAMTHCDDLIDQYYITSDDMVGKAGVWGHFGSWDFNKASMYNKVYDKKREEGIKILTEEFGLDEEDASSIYYEIRTTGADKWVSPWPGYMNIGSCSVNNNVAVCSNGLIVNLTNYNSVLSLKEGKTSPYSLVYADGEEIKEKVFEGGTAGISAALIPEGSGYKSILLDPLHAKGIFTRLFFFKGHGLNCFDFFSYKKSFTGNEIYVWKVDWECKTKTIIEEFNKKEAEESAIELETVENNKSADE